MAAPMETYDYLIIGSGIAGLSLALKAAAHGSVAIVTKDCLPESNSAYAQGGIASVWSPEDSFAAHIQDTLIAGADLCHEDVANSRCKSPRVVRPVADRRRSVTSVTPDRVCQACAIGAMRHDNLRESMRCRYPT